MDNHNALGEINGVILDYDKQLTLQFLMDSTTILNNATYKLKLKRYVDTAQSSEQYLYFKSELTYPAFQKIIQIFEQDSRKRGYQFTATEQLQQHICEREMHIQKRSNIGLAIKNQNPEVMAPFAKYKEIVDKAFHRKLREKQMWDSFFMYSMKKVSNFSVPGSGKTASVLGVFAYLKETTDVNRIVMVGPKNAFGSWVDEFHACFGDKLDLRVFDIQNSVYKSVADKKTALRYETGSANLILLNYDCLRTYLPEVKHLMGAQSLLVFDEVHKIKAINGSNAERALALAYDSAYTIALTGTPIPNSYTDIHNLLHALYHDEYQEFFGFTVPQLKNPTPQDLDIINQKLQPFFCRTTKQQLQVPKANQDLICNIPASQSENELFRILQIKYARSRLVLIIRLLQLESNPAMLLKSLDLADFADILDISKETDEIDYVDYSQSVLALITSIKKTTKFEMCIQTVCRLHDENKPSIIWCIFVDSIVRLASELEKRGLRVGCIYGETSPTERAEIIKSFRNGRLDVLITNPHTLAESVSLHSVCHDAIYYEYSYNLVHLLQSKDRIHRLGLPSNQYTQYYYLQSHFATSDGEDFSLDEKILDRLEEKEQIMLDAIENNVLEKVFTTQEDLDAIFGDLLKK